MLLLILKGLFIISVIDIKGISSGGYFFPYWTLITGNLISASTLLGIIVWPIYLIILEVGIKKKVNFKIHYELHSNFIQSKFFSSHLDLF